MHYLSFDAETHLITQQTGPMPQPVCWSFYSPTMPVPALLSERFDFEEVTAMLARALEDPSITLIGQNVGFDILLLWRYHDIPMEMILHAMREGRIQDTSIREKLIHIATYRPNQPERRTGLDTLVKRYLHLDISEDKKDPLAWRLRYSELTDVPIVDYPKKAYNYAVDDARLTYEVYQEQQRYAPTCFKDAAFQGLADLSLKLMAAHSPRVDQPRVALLRESQQTIYDEVKELLIEEGLLRFNKNRYAKDFPKDDPRRGGYSVNTKVLKQRVEADCLRQGIQPVRSAKTQAISTSAEALAPIEDPVVQAYATVQGARKMLDAFIPALEKAGEHPIGVSYDVLKTTGRTSSARINIQQMPRAEGTRECFIPRRDGNLFACIDYDSFELAALAQVAYEDFQSTAMRDAINSGKDLHSLTGAQLIGQDYEDFMSLLKAGRQHQEDVRQAAKAFSFGVPGGLGPTTFIRTLDEEQRNTLRALYPDEPLDDIIRRLIFQWKDQWDLHAYFERIARATRNDRLWTYVHPFTGRTRGGLGYSNGLNVQFQGRCADAAKVAMVLLTEDIYCHEGVLAAHGVTASAFMHDEFMFEGPPMYLKEWTQRAEQLMIQGASVVIPDVAIRAEAQVMDRWQKKGEKVEKYIQKMDLRS